MDWKKKAIIVTIMILILSIVFFYPKINNIWEQGGKSKDCTCVGFTKMEMRSKSSPQQVKICYGFSFDCKCTQNINQSIEEISCDEIPYLPPS